MKFSDKVIDVPDLTLIGSATAVSFVGCRSKEWTQIGKRLATLPRFFTLIVENCDSADSLCAGVCSAKSLESIRIGTSTVTQNVAASATKASENYAK
jgi:hypothetical protein